MANPTMRNSIIFIADAILFFVLLNTLPFAPEANKGLALLAFVAILWLTEAVHVTITALMIPLLAIGLGLAKTKDALHSFADPTIFLFFGGFALAAALNIQKIDRLIANKIMAMAKGNLFVAVIYLFTATAFLSMWMSNTATAAMMLPLAMGILSKLDPKKEHNTYSFVLLGIAYSASIGGIGTLVGSPPNAIAAAPLGIDFGEWLQFGVPIMLVLMPLMIGSLYVVLKPNFSAGFEFEFEKIEMTTPRILTLAVFILTAACWAFGSYVNPWVASLLGLSGKIASFDTVVAISTAILLVLLRLVDWKQIQENTEWGVLFLFGGGLMLSSILGKTGASKIMADGIVALIEGQHYFVIALIISAFIIILTEFTSNTASAALLVPIFISIAQVLNIDPKSYALIIAIGASCAFMMPVATPPNAIVFATGHIKQSEMIRVGAVLNALCIVVVAVIAYLFWM